MAQVAPSGFSTKLWQPDGADPPILFDRYQILGIIGEGGMGTVFKAYHLNLKRHVAIKTLRIEHRKSAEMVSRFLKEMELVGQMDHPNVVRATDAGEKNGVFYLVMEYLSGSDLSRLVSHKGKLDISTACELTRQAALGLDYVHQTLIHRDIKPSNLLLTTAGLVKILDLGLARFGFGTPVARENTPYGCAVGTYAYMAPEQADGVAEIDGRADLYSLGCTLYKLVTGHAPYSGSEYGSAAKVLYAHCHVPLTAVASFAEVPTQMRDVLLKMMAKNRDDRYQTGKEIAAVLAPFIEGGVATSSHVLGSGSSVTEETPVKPLPRPLPAELSRLTDGPQETPVNTPNDAIGVPVRRRVRGRWLVACMLACLLAPAAWVTVVPLLRERPAAPPAHFVLRDLDALVPRKQFHALLDQKPLTLASELDDPRLCRWEKDGNLVDVIGSGKILFFLGKSEQARYTFEVAINQSPWTGNVGVFWGYQEDQAAKDAMAPMQPFARFQMLRIERRPGNQENVYSVKRIKGVLRFNNRGEIAIEQFTVKSMDIPYLTTGEQIMQIVVDGNRLKFARLGAVQLTDLYSPAADDLLVNEPCKGALGLITLTHAVTFRDARIRSDN